jgi:hypothetical protein
MGGTDQQREHPQQPFRLPSCVGTILMSRVTQIRYRARAAFQLEKNWGCSCTTGAVNSHGVKTLLTLQSSHGRRGEEKSKI